MALALFDLDNTLLNGDSDYLWGRFLADGGLVDAATYEAENRRFYEDYKRGELDIQAYLRFQLGFLAGKEREELDRLHQRFMAEVIAPIRLPAASALLEQHRRQGDRLVIITATNRFVTGPIARSMGVEHLLATELEEDGAGRFTGRPRGIPCFHEGKVTRLEAWMALQGETLAGSWFYSDSRNDLPLLQRVAHPVAVDPDPVLETEARRRGWKILSLRS
ncbi:MAG: HAD family hydrolase [Magnetococcales bacterium]|nr:HAD family hydrolase [Magnetococcales bacterium]